MRSPTSRLPAPGPGSPPSPLISTICSLVVSLAAFLIATRSAVRPFGLSLSSSQGGNWHGVRRRKSNPALVANRPTAMDQLLFNLGASVVGRPSSKCCRRRCRRRHLSPRPPTGPGGPDRPAPTRRALTPRRGRSRSFARYRCSTTAKEQQCSEQRQLSSHLARPAGRRRRRRSNAFTPLVDSTALAVF